MTLKKNPQEYSKNSRIWIKLSFGGNVPQVASQKLGKKGPVLVVRIQKNAFQYFFNYFFPRYYSSLKILTMHTTNSLNINNAFESNCYNCPGLAFFGSNSSFLWTLVCQQSFNVRTTNTNSNFLNPHNLLAHMSCCIEALFCCFLYSVAPLSNPFELFICKYPFDFNCILVQFLMKHLKHSSCSLRHWNLWAIFLPKMQYFFVPLWGQKLLAYTSF